MVHSILNTIERKEIKQNILAKIHRLTVKQAVSQWVWICLLHMRN